MLRLPPSFPHALSGNPGEFGTGPPMKKLGADGLLNAELFGRSAMLRCPVRLVFNKKRSALAFDADHGRSRVL